MKGAAYMLYFISLVIYLFIVMVFVFPLSFFAAAIQLCLERDKS